MTIFHLNDTMTAVEILVGDILMKNLVSFLKKEVVLTISGILAIASCFLVRPDAQYAGYIDWHTILILFCLMAVMCGFKDIGLFQFTGESLLKKIQSARGVVSVLVFLCFFSSMFITNDVALITFVPLALLILNMAKMNDSLCYIMTLMTIAANLGSMLTPIGNPQNLYLYSTSGLSLGSFVMLMLPYTIIAAALLLVCIFARFKKSNVQVELGNASNEMNVRRILYYGFLFVVCLLAVAKICPIELLFGIILIAVIIDNRKLLLHIDYSLLLTFIFFFIFIGNMGRFPVFRDFLAGILEGRVTLVAVLSSQIISNVPAALLLSGFTNDWNSLIIGTNLGGLGTLIASMASLISYKQLAANHPNAKGKYMVVFTVANIAFLIVLYGAYMLLA